MTFTGLSVSRGEVKMSTALESNSHSRPLSSAREVRENNLEAKHAGEKRVHEYLERLADFLQDAMAQFWPEASGKPVVNLMLSSPEGPSEIRLRIDDSGRVVDITNEPQF
jgi:hypothetical protein